MATQKETPKKKASLKTMKKDVQEEKVEVPHKKEGIQRVFIGKVKNFNATVKKSMVSYSKKTEKWHNNAAVWPLERLAKIDRFEQTADDMIAIQAKTIGHSYDLLRTVVTKVDDIADEILTRAAKRYAA